jgi:hypothetical protein
LWVAGSENVRVIGNELYGSPTGLEITVANNVLAIHNDIHDNTVGVGLYHPNAAGNPQKPVMANWVIEHNAIYDNNLPNPAPPGSFQAGLLPGFGVPPGRPDHVSEEHIATTLAGSPSWAVSATLWSDPSLAASTARPRRIARTTIWSTSIG